MTFFRAHTDDTRESAALNNHYGSIDGSECWLIGGGPSLTEAPLDDIQNSPVPIMCMNFAGRGLDGSPPLLTPDLWTAFDPCVRFHKSMLLNSKPAKFLKWSYHKDLVFDSTQKMCDCPNTWFFDTQHRGYKDFIDPASGKINHSRDTMIQAIDILYHLGFRTIYLVGCELIVKPSDSQIKLARDLGVVYEKGKTEVAPKKDGALSTWSDRLDVFLKSCDERGVGVDRQKTVEKLISVDRERQYSFSETKSFQAAANTDAHYFATVQRLRLARRCISLCGLKIVSCTLGSRLNEYFRFLSPDTVCKMLLDKYGDPATEHTTGRYKDDFEKPGELYPLMQDIEPEGWGELLKRNRDIDIEFDKADRMGDIANFYDELRHKGNDKNGNQQIEEVF